MLFPAQLFQSGISFQPAYFALQPVTFLPRKAAALRGNTIENPAGTLFFEPQQPRFERL